MSSLGELFLRVGGSIVSSAIGDASVRKDDDGWVSGTEAKLAAGGGGLSPLPPRVMRRAAAPGRGHWEGNCVSEMAAPTSPSSGVGGFAAAARGLIRANAGDECASTQGEEGGVSRAHNLCPDRYGDGDRKKENGRKMREERFFFPGWRNYSVQYEGLGKRCSKQKEATEKWKGAYAATEWNLRRW